LCIGTAIVTETKAAMWADGRYYLQAREQMDDNWLLMKDGTSVTFCCWSSVLNDGIFIFLRRMCHRLALDACELTLLAGFFQSSLIGVNINWFRNCATAC